jgi:hypothetical protein
MDDLANRPTAESAQRKTRENSRTLRSRRLDILLETAFAVTPPDQTDRWQPPLTGELPPVQPGLSERPLKAESRHRDPAGAVGLFGQATFLLAPVLVL